MPKHSPLNDESEYFAQLGRMTIAAGIRYLQPQMNAWLEAQLQTLLADAGVAHNGVDKPVRSTKTLQAAEASLGALVGVSANGKKLGRPPLNRDAVPDAPAPSHKAELARTAMKKYWEQFTPEQRRQMTFDKMAKRTDPFAKQVLKNNHKPKGMRGWPTTDMIDGRYTKVGAARVLGISVKSLGYVLARTAKPIPMLRTGTGKGRTGTYNPADIEALAASRRSK